VHFLACAKVWVASTTLCLNIGKVNGVMMLTPDFSGDGQETLNVLLCVCELVVL